jgi:hypothetical protein
MSVGARVLKWQQLRAYAWPPVTEYFYPHKLHGGDSVDGDARRLGYNLIWSDVHDGAGTSAYPDDLDSQVYIRCGTAVGYYEVIHRFIMTYPTNSLAANAQIDAGEIRVFCEYVRIEGSGVPTVAVFESWPAAYNNLVVADYQNVGAVPLSNLINFADLVVGGFNTFTLNPAGLDKIVLGGVTKLALREATWDAPNIPANWTAYADRNTFWSTADSLYSDRYPRLAVTYRVPPP